MPYICQENRKLFDDVLDNIVVADGGELQYVIARLVQKYYEDFCDGEPRYADMERMMGALQGAALEHYRCVVAPYEDEKIKGNGGVYDVHRGIGY